ncbi:hypothetical protein BU17DRAFT_48833 [Hysterangium stoloniferum]|nr:hypothetical protein BU17DRAFT_48833 [Hysterangium stoloniferum]
MTTLYPLFLLLVLSVKATDPSQAASPCRCNFGYIPTFVNVTIPSDPSTPRGLSSTDFNLQTNINVYGELCQPVNIDYRFQGSIQLLVHGLTYTSKYWDVKWNGYENYSFVEYSCRQGISSFAFDTIGTGRTSRPKMSRDCQLPTAANITSSLARDLKSGRVSSLLTGHKTTYKKVIGIGHSLGSVILNYAAVAEGGSSPFDGLMLTGITNEPIAPTTPASDVDPGRFSGLDPGYITSPDINFRTFFYGDTESYSPKVLQMDELTKDTGSRWMLPQISAVYAPANGFKAPVLMIIGEFDKALCLPYGGPCTQEKLQAEEPSYFPDSENFAVTVVPNGSHSLNLEFTASLVFETMATAFENFVRKEQIGGLYSHMSNWQNGFSVADLFGVGV